ncbi:MAG: hypothetical protein HZB92_04245 [Euryarchaeota archaeon]|nr:hypothetical protein [Euryarchaeota archaeon]
MPPVPERRYLRYVVTSTLSKVIAPLNNEQILRLTARRSWENEKVHLDPPHHYIEHTNSSKTWIDVDYNGRVDGTFDKEGLLTFLTRSGALDMTVQEMDVMLPDNPAILQRIADRFEDSKIKEQPLVIRYVSNPLRREKEDNDYTRKVRANTTEIERQLGFDPASLDLHYGIPLSTWREVARGVISKQYQDWLKSWQTKWHDDLPPEIIRDISRTVHPDMCGGREYTLRRGTQDGWTLTAHEDS